MAVVDDQSGPPNLWRRWLGSKPSQTKVGVAPGGPVCVQHAPPENSLQYILPMVMALMSRRRLQVRPSLSLAGPPWLKAVINPSPSQDIAGFVVTYSNAPAGTTSVLTKAVILRTIWPLVLPCLVSDNMVGGTASKATVS